MSDEPNKMTHPKRVNAKKRTYFFDVRTNRDGIQYLCITETNSSIGTKCERHQVMIRQEQMESFHNAYLKAAERFNLPSQPQSEKPETSSSRVNRIRKAHANAYKKWTSEEDQSLCSRFNQGTDIDALATLLQRQPSAIRSRLSKLGLDPIALHPNRDAQA